VPASELIGKPSNDVLVALDWKNLVTRFGEIAHVNYPVGINSAKKA
jgi:hypothetical protein